jgi:serine/threonine-protein kinase
MRHSISLAAVLALAAVAVAIVLLLGDKAANNIQRGTGPGRNAAPPPGTRVVSVSGASAHAYDPFGGDGEHDADAPHVVDRDPGTTWATEHYTGGVLNKPGVGIYIDAKPEVDAKSIEIDSKPGWHAELYAAPAGTVPAGIDHGWVKVGAGNISEAEQRLRLATDGHSYRYYLVWITKLPPGASQVEIAEIKLFAPKPA